MRWGNNVNRVGRVNDALIAPDETEWENKTWGRRVP